MLSYSQYPSKNHSDEYNLLQAIRGSKYSDDPRTKNAALIVSTSGRWIVENNHFLNNIYFNFSEEDKYNKEIKDIYLEHAERAAIYSAAKYDIDCYDAVLYSPWVGCVACSRGIVLSGIKRVVTLKNFYKSNTWEREIELGRQLMENRGVKIEYMELNSFTGEKLFFGGKEIIL